MSLKTLKFPLDAPLTLPAVPATYIKCDWSDNILQQPKYDVPVPFSASPVFGAEIIDASILSSGGDVKTAFEIIFKLAPGIDHQFSPGDTVGILPENSPKEVDSLINLMGLKDLKNKVCSIVVSAEAKKKMLPNYIPPQTSVEELLSKCLHIRFPPKKLMLRSLSGFTSDDQEKRRLEELSSREGSEEYSKFFIAQALNILDVLEAFKSCQPPLELLIEHLPRLQPRPYSVASSPLTDQSSFRIVLSLIESKIGSGICSGYLLKTVEKFLSSKNIDLSSSLSHLSLNDDSTCTSSSCPKAPLYFRSSNQFRMQNDLSIPLILIGPGTGVAPFLGFLEHKKMLLTNSSIRSECWLFFGCRNERDFIYRKEIEQFLDEEILTKLFVSFSRSENAAFKSKYVQDNIILIKEEFVNLLLEEKTLLFICGDAKNMMKDVLQTIKCCLSEVNGSSIDEADIMVNSFQKKGKIITDSWV